MTHAIVVWCPNCGTPLTEERCTVSPEGVLTHCPNCGSRNEIRDANVPKCVGRIVVLDSEQIATLGAPGGRVELDLDGERFVVRGPATKEEIARAKEWISESDAEATLDALKRLEARGLVVEGNDDDSPIGLACLGRVVGRSNGRMLVRRNAGGAEWDFDDLGWETGTEVNVVIEVAKDPDK